MMINLSVFIICENEAERIGMVLESVKNLSQDIVVVDSGSTDGTLEIVSRYTDRIFHRDWTGFGDQKVYAEGLCKYDWILNLDADEVITPEASSSIKKVIAEDPKNLGQSPGYELRVTMMSRLTVRQQPSILAPYNYTGRFYDRRYAGFSSNAVHDKLTNRDTGSVSFPRLKGDILHYSIKSYSHMWEKIGRYSQLQAEEWHRKGRKAPLYSIVWIVPFFFIKHYLFRRQFALGFEGLVVAVALTAGRALRVIMLKELERRH
jgi:glycosyltransferase involved in cell wall biosynthesis